MNSQWNNNDVDIDVDVVIDIGVDVDINIDIPIAIPIAIGHETAMKGQWLVNDWAIISRELIGGR